MTKQGGSITHHPGLVKERAEAIASEVGRIGQPNDDDTAQAKTEVANEIKACFMLSGANNGRQEELKNYLENHYAMGSDKYPRDTSAALTLLNTFRETKRHQPRYVKREGDDEGGNFAQAAEKDDDNDGDNAPTEKGVQMLMDGSATKRKPKKGRKKAAAAAKSSYADAAKTVRFKTPAGSEGTGGKPVTKPPEGTGKPTKCIQYGGPHELASCPDITDEQLGEIYAQLCELEGDDDNEYDDDDAEQGANFAQLGSEHPLDAEDSGKAGAAPRQAGRPASFL